MRCPNLTDLPPAPADKSGWPWTEEAPPFPVDESEAANWPSIAIVTPTYNSEEYLEATIRSVLLQGYPELEYVIVDGNSSDKTVEIIRKYEKWLTSWVSEPDSGQSDAINKGLRRSHSEIVNWLCSDDLLAPGALQVVGRTFAESVEIDVVHGKTLNEYEFHPELNSIHQTSLEKIAEIPVINSVSQPSCFFRRALLTREPPLDESFHYALDSELWAFFNSRKARWKVIDAILSTFRYTESNKTLVGGRKIVRDLDRVYRRYVDEWIPLSFWCRWIRYPLECLHVRFGRTGWIRKPLTAMLHCYLLLLSPFYGSKRVRAVSWRWIPERANSIEQLRKKETST